MTFRTFNMKSIDKFIKEQRRMGSQIRWDGWDVVVWKYHPNGFTSRYGAFRNGRWGLQTRIAVDEKGLWNIPSNYILGNV